MPLNNMADRLLLPHGRAPKAHVLQLNYWG